MGILYYWNNGKRNYLYLFVHFGRKPRQLGGGVGRCDAPPKIENGNFVEEINRLPKYMYFGNGQFALYWLIFDLVNKGNSQKEGSKSSTHYLGDKNRFDVSSKGPSSGISVGGRRKHACFYTSEYIKTTCDKIKTNQMDLIKTRNK